MHQTRRQQLEYKFRTGQITPREMDEFTNKIPTYRSPWRSPTAWLVAALIVTVLLSVAGCEGSPAQPAKADQKPVPSFYSVSLYTDPDTGCEYLAQYRGGITPRLDRNGKQVCK